MSARFTLTLCRVNKFSLCQFPWEFGGIWYSQQLNSYFLVPSFRSWNIIVKLNLLHMKKKKSCVCVYWEPRVWASINYELSKYEREFSDFKERERSRCVHITTKYIYDICVMWLGMDTKDFFNILIIGKILPKPQTPPRCFISDSHTPVIYGTHIVLCKRWRACEKLKKSFYLQALRFCCSRCFPQIINLSCVNAL